MKPEELLVCVPNFSEGRRAEVVSAIAGALERAGPAAVLAVEADPDHNRMVATLAGRPGDLIEALRAGAGVARRTIDLNTHEGLHPRIGALDVCPFVPFAGEDRSAAREAAERTAARLWDELEIPAYLYEAAARRPERRNLAAFRNRGFEHLRVEAPRDPDLAPDVGGPGLHPTAGAAAVGARGVLIAFNVVLAGASPERARAIARAVRARDGGLPGVKALGFALRDGCVQVSMNLTRPAETGILEAFRAVAERAAVAGAAVVRSEIVGLPPERYFDPAWAAELKLAGGDPAERVLERRAAAAGLL